VKRIHQIDELYEWLGKAGRNHEAVYHEGHLSVDRLKNRNLAKLADACLRLSQDKFVSITQRRIDGQWQYLVQIVNPMSARQIVTHIVSSPVRKT